jgi:hypothetical protein
MANKVKTGGRQKGTPNKVSAELRQELSRALSDDIDNLPDTLQELAPADRVEATLKLCKFLLPPLAATQPQTADKLIASPESYRLDIESDIKNDNLFRL